jgi:hypothetical protein
VHRLPVDRHADAVPVPDDRLERAEPRERVPAPAVVLAPVDEVRVDPERDVVEEEPAAHAADVDAPHDAVDERVESACRVVAVEPEVAREVVPRPERHADERQPALDRDVCNDRERPVAARHAERLRVRAARDLLEVVLVAEDVCGDAARPRRRQQLLDAAVAGGRVNDQITGQGGLSYPKKWADRLMRTSGGRAIIVAWTSAGPCTASRTT